MCAVDNDQAITPCENGMVSCRRWPPFWHYIHPGMWRAQGSSPALTGLRPVTASKEWYQCEPMGTLMDQPVVISRSTNHLDIDQKIASSLQSLHCAHSSLSRLWWNHSCWFILGLGDGFLENLWFFAGGENDAEMQERTASWTRDDVFFLVDFEKTMTHTHYGWWYDNHGIPYQHLSAPWLQWYLTRFGNGSRFSRRWWYHGDTYFEISYQQGGSLPRILCQISAMLPWWHHCYSFVGE